MNPRMAENRESEQERAQTINGSDDERYCEQNKTLYQIRHSSEQLQFTENI